MIIDWAKKIKDIELYQSIFRLQISHYDIKSRI